MINFTRMRVVLGFLVLATAGVGCGLKPGFPTETSNDNNPPPPSNATLVGQAFLGGENNATVNGTVQAYDDKDGTYVVQLQNLNAKFPTPYENVWAEIGGSMYSGGALVSNSGTSNYTFKVGQTNATVCGFYIYCTNCTGGVQYASARLCPF